MTRQELERAAADLDLVRQLGGITARRAESLRTAAAVLRTIASGEVSRALAALLIGQGVISPGARHEEAGR